MPNPPFGNASFLQGFAVPAQRGIDLNDAIDRAFTAVNGLTDTADTANQAATDARNAAIDAAAQASSIRDDTLAIVGSKMDIAGGTFTGLFTGPSAKLGTYGWLEAIIGGTEAITHFTSLSPHGGPGIVLGTRTSDDKNISFGQGAFSLGVFAINDNTAAEKQTYGIYNEVRRIGPVNGSTLGAEFCAINNGPNDVPITPFTYQPLGVTGNLQLDAGRIDTTPGHRNGNTSYYLLCAGQPTAGGPQVLSGIVFGADGLVANNGTSPGWVWPMAIDMPSTYSFVWRNRTNGNVVSSVLSKAVYPTEGGTLIFTKAGEDGATAGGFLLKGNGAASVQADGTSLTLAGSTTFINGVTFNSDVGFGGKVVATKGMTLSGLTYASGNADAASKGVAVNDIFINSANSNALTIRIA